MMRRVACDLLPSTHIPLVEFRDGFGTLVRASQRRLQRRQHHDFMENEVIDALNSLTGSRQAQIASLPVALTQSCSL